MRASVRGGLQGVSKACSADAGQLARAVQRQELSRQPTCERSHPEDPLVLPALRSRGRCEVEKQPWDSCEQSRSKTAAHP